MAWPHEALRSRREIMADGRNGMSGWRIALNIVGAMLGFLVFGAGGCDSGACSCSGTFSEAVIAVIPSGCETPVVKTTGPCSVCPVVLANGEIPEGPHCESQHITLIANGTGTCHVEVTFGSGATSSVDVDFISQWLACGSDPHGCGQLFVATNQVSVPEPTCDAGLDGEASD
jgi:hypothetical protein